MTDTLLQSEPNLTSIKNKYELLIQKINQELQSQREEQERLKVQVLSVIEDNNCINNKIDTIQSTTHFETAGEHEKLTNDAISNLKQQVQHLKEERTTINLLWKTSQETISNLETEIQNYRKQLFKPTAFTEIKKKYCSTIKTLENIISKQKSEIFKQANAIRDLIKAKQETTDRLKELEKVIFEQEKQLSGSQQLHDINSDLKKKLLTALQTNSELEISNSITRNMIDERFVREKKALEKLQEALCIAETAVYEKEEAIKREIVIKEECELLATTIGQVIEEAARKVERNLESLKQQYEEKEKELIRKHQDALLYIESQKKATQAAETKCNLLEQKLIEILKENKKFDTDLQLASEAIIEMELKLEATDNLLKEDKRYQRIFEEREKQIRQYMDNNQQLKNKWKYTIEMVTKKFSNEIERMQLENSKLKAELQSQKLKTTN